MKKLTHTLPVLAFACVMSGCSMTYDDWATVSQGMASGVQEGSNAAMYHSSNQQTRAEGCANSCSIDSAHCNSLAQYASSHEETLYEQRLCAAEKQRCTAACYY